MAAGAPIVEVDGVVKRFGTTVALDGLDLAVEEGRVVALLGRNGAGKTTLVRVLATLTPPDSGRVRIGGVDVQRDPHAVRRTIGLAGQYASVDETLTGRENLEFVGRCYQLPAKEARRRAREVLERLQLEGAADRPVRTYSGGMRRRLDVGASLVGRPRVLMLDEPTTGLDPVSRAEVWDFVEELVHDGTTLLLTTQYLEEADRLAGDIVVVDAGRVIATGSPDALKLRFGNEVLDLSVAAAADLDRAAEVVRSLGRDEPQLDRTQQRLTLALRGGTNRMVDAVRLLDGAGVDIVDIALRRPSLDDVFVALTSTSATPEPVKEPA
jgi:ABC-2 type transport system ATP-binding protein